MPRIATLFQEQDCLCDQRHEIALPLRERCWLSEIQKLPRHQFQSLGLAKNNVEQLKLGRPLFLHQLNTAADRG